MPAYAGPLGVAGVKIVTGNTKNSVKYVLPTIQAATVLNDAKTGLPIALMGASYSRMIRIGAVAAVAAKYLSRKDSKVAGIIGAGVQVRGQLMGLVEVRSIQKPLVYDISREQSEKYGEEMSQRLGIEVLPLETSEKIAGKVDILAIAAPASAPVISDKRLSAGVHVNAVGVSTGGKQEIPTETCKRSKCVVDQYEQTSKIGGMSVTVSSGDFGRKDLYA